MNLIRDSIISNVFKKNPIQYNRNTPELAQLLQTQDNK